MFWLFMNWGKWFSSPRKIALTVLNIIIIGIGAALVGILQIPFVDILLTGCFSVVSAFGCPARPSTIIPAVRVFRVRIMLNSKNPFHPAFFSSFWGYWRSSFGVSQLQFLLHLPGFLNNHIPNFCLINLYDPERTHYFFGSLLSPNMTSDVNDCISSTIL